jgi:hypothetical protein
MRGEKDDLGTAPLRCELGERPGDAQRGTGVDSEFVVAAAQILEEGVPGDHHRLQHPQRRVKNRRAAAASRCAESSTSMTRPCRSTARYT